LTADEVGAGAEVFMPPANTLSPRSVKPINPINDFQKLTDEHSTYTDGLEHHTYGLPKPTNDRQKHK
jgi:hypothetical protein